MKLLTCPCCGSDDIALQESQIVERDAMKAYYFVIYLCTFFCHTCGHEFETELDADERKDYL